MLQRLNNNILAFWVAQTLHPQVSAAAVAVGERKVELIDVNFCQ